jgi:hypothetical protein
MNNAVTDPTDGAGVSKVEEKPKTFAESMATLVLSNPDIKKELLTRLVGELHIPDGELDELVKKEIDSYIENDAKGLVIRIMDEGHIDIRGVLDILCDTYSTSDILEEFNSNDIADYVNDNGDFSVSLR